MTLLEKVLTAFKLCQQGESGKCEECPYFQQNNCKYQFLAKDAEKIITDLRRGIYAVADLYHDNAHLTIEEKDRVIDAWLNFRS